MSLIPDLPDPYISHTEPEALIPNRIVRRVWPAGVAEVFLDRTPGTTYCPDCHRPMLSHRWLGASLLCPAHALWDAALPRWEPA